MTERVVLRIVPDGLRWKLVYPPDVDLCRTDSQRRAIRIGRSICHALESEGRPSQLVVHGEDGRIAREFTYLHDPPSIKG